MTDDEREAQGWREAALYAEDAESQDDFMTGWRTADRLRRTEVSRMAPVPPCACPCHTTSGYSHIAACCTVEPQGEPSDAQVEAAAVAIWSTRGAPGTWDALTDRQRRPYRTDARAALRAAGRVR